MGWLRLGRSAWSTTGRQCPNSTEEDDLKATTQHIERLSISDTTPSPALAQMQKYRKYPFQPADTPNSSLPFIPATEVLSKADESSSRSLEDLWIVIDGIVYDCSEFVHSHPGGEEVIKNFKGQDCSWQFWRFHGREQLERDGWALRIGRTEGVTNRYPEPPRYVGLRRLGDADGDW
ncbi:fatty acid desaturas-like protein [Thermoascus aurantiacus ATCC 26904]